ncbi:MAG: PQQ-binding-like beta-propeller repeat protein [Verrucomicrobiales bacterium]|nr:PQQ-binding-like beta-propeller repeat protein [Verrucomicrobiales bacterium]
MKGLTIILAICSSWVLSAGAGLADWPDFRGPTQDGHVAEGQELPLKWGEKENVKWKTAIHGEGWASPVVMDGKVWVATARADGLTLSAMCLDQKTGEILLDRVLVTDDNPEPTSNRINNFAASSPVVEKGRVYFHFGSSGTICLDANTYEELWRRVDFPCSHWRGAGSSPALWRDKIYLTFDGADQQYLVALDKKTGKTLWRKDRSTQYNDLDAKGRPSSFGDARKAYGTPVFIEVGGKTQMISAGAKACWAYNPETGEELWSVSYPQHSGSSMPVYSKDLGILYINTGLGKPQIMAMKMDDKARGDISETHLLWKLIKRVSKQSSPVLVGGELYMAADNVAACIDAKTGEVLWSERLKGKVTASLIYGAGRVYFYDETGGTTVVKAARSFELLAHNQLEEGSLASPAAAGGAIFLRSKGFLYRIGD